jgi:cell division transport system permease protein
MSLSYLLAESVSGFRRTKLSSVVSIMTICIALLLLGVFMVVTTNAARFVDALRTKVELEAFLRQPMTPVELDSLRAAVRAVDGVASVTYVSKEEASRIFKQEFGEDILDVLTFNPLPPSLRIGLVPGAITAAGTRAVSDRVSGMAGVDTVIYRRALVELIDRRAEQFNSVTLGLGVLIGLSAILLVSNTIRLAIYAKRRLIRTMELVGATWAFIRLPFLLEGMIQGVLGGAVASGMLYLAIGRLVPALSQEVAGYIQVRPGFYLLIVAAGIALGLVGSVISVVRFIRPRAT